jgi:hypothetical protein
MSVYDIANWQRLEFDSRNIFNPWLGQHSGGQWH